MIARHVSLIVATRWRTKEVRRLLDSLVGQTYQVFDIIAVDQNDDNRIQSCWRSTTPLDYKTCSLQGVRQSGGK